MITEGSESDTSYKMIGVKIKRAKTNGEILDTLLTKIECYLNELNEYILSTSLKKKKEHSIQPNKWKDLLKEASDYYDNNVEIILFNK